MADGGSAAAGKKAGAPEKPLSPHLQVWRWHATMWTSILHRATGVGLYVGALGFALWLVSVSLGPQIYVFGAGLIGSPFGQLVLWAIVFCVCFHILSGLRHLVWDVGFGFKKQTASFWSIVIVLGAIAMTAGLYVWVMSAPPPQPQFGGMPIQ